MSEQQKPAEKPAENTQQKPSEQQKPAEKPAGTEAGNGKMFGNKDSKREYPFCKTWDKHIVARQSQNHPGSKDENSETVRLMPYSPDVFDSVNESGGFKGINVRIIHDPRK